MKNAFTLFAVLLVSMSASFSQNLVPNSDFEERDANYCGIAGPTDLENALANWYSPTSGSPDVYFTDIDPACWNYQTASTYPGPIGLKGPQLPRSGSSMIGVGLYTISGMNQREYVQVQLSSPMIPSVNYLVEFYVSLADYTEFASNNMGFHLSTTAVTNGGNGVLSVSPQYSLTNAVSDVQAWVRVVDTITASDAFEFLTIGNFSDDASTSVVANPSASFEPGMYGAYYFIDDVRVERIVGDSSVNTHHLEQSAPYSIFPNPASEEVTIELHNGNTQLQIDLLDVNGKLVWTTEDTGGKQLIDLRPFDGGVYFIRIEMEGKFYVEKITKYE